VSLPPKTHPSSHLKLAFKKEEMFVPEVATDVVLSVAVKFWLKKIFKVDSSCKKPLVICNGIFSIFLNQIKAQRDQKIIVWIEYFPYKYSFKVISND
jgi:hypothetical protein